MTAPKRKPLPCPFDGYRATVESSHISLFRVRCTYCDIVQPRLHTTFEGAIAAWNRRASNRKTNVAPTKGGTK